MLRLEIDELCVGGPQTFTEVAASRGLAVKFETQVAVIAGVGTNGNSLDLRIMS